MLKPTEQLAEVYLQSVTFEDVEQVQAWYKDPELQEYFRRYPPLEEWRLPEQTLQGLGAGFAIFEGAQLVGLCQTVNYDPSAKSVEVGLLVDTKKASNREAVSREAYTQLAEYLLNGLGYRKLYMKVLTHRTKLVKRLASGCWKVEGELRDSCTFKGKLLNEYLLGLLKKDFNAWKNQARGN